MGSFLESELLLGIANNIYKLFDCTQLAILLGVDYQIVDALKEETRDPHTIAFGVLEKWRQKEDATEQKLYNALNNEPFKHLARRFKRDLETASARETRSDSDPASEPKAKKAYQASAGETRSDSDPASEPKAKKVSQDSASASCKTQTGQGKKLTPGALFGEISERITNIEEVYKVADVLLEGIERQGGTAWVKAETAPGGVPKPQLNMRAVLDHWYNHSPDTPYGVKLYGELVKILPRVAEDFKEVLLSEDQAIVSRGHSTSPDSTSS